MKKKEEDETVEIVKTWGRIPGALCLVWNFQLFRINFCCSCCQQNISIPKCSQLLTLARLSATPPLLLPPVPPYPPVLISMPHKMIIKQQFAARKKIWNFSTARMLLCVCVWRVCEEYVCVCVCNCLRLCEQTFYINFAGRFRHTINTFCAFQFVSICSRRNERRRRRQIKT